MGLKKLEDLIERRRQKKEDRKKLINSLDTKRLSELAEIGLKNLEIKASNIWVEMIFKSELMDDKKEEYSKIVDLLKYFGANTEEYNKMLQKAIEKYETKV